MLSNDVVLNMDYDDQTRLINWSITFLHGKVRLITHKATFVNIINKTNISKTIMKWSCQGTARDECSKVYNQSIKCTQGI